MATDLVSKNAINVPNFGIFGRYFVHMFFIIKQISMLNKNSVTPLEDFQTGNSNEFLMKFHIEIKLKMNFYPGVVL